MQRDYHINLPPRDSRIEPEKDEKMKNFQNFKENINERPRET